MDSVRFNVSLAPDYLTQSILPNWNVSMFTINLGSSPRPETEQTILREVGSYGRQIGHLAEALEVVIDSLQLLQSSALTQAQRDVLAVFLADVSKARMIKR